MNSQNFSRGDFVRKKSGSWWEGRVVGFYSTEQSPDGVAVQLDKPMGPVQIYPAAALEIAPAPQDHAGVSIAALQSWSEQKYGKAFSISACHDLLNVLKDVAPSEPKRWLLEEHLPGGTVRWHCFEHEHQCRARGVISQHEVTITALFASTPPQTRAIGGHE